MPYSLFTNLGIPGPRPSAFYGNFKQFSSKVRVELIVHGVMMPVLPQIIIEACNKWHVEALYTRFVDCRLVDSRFFYTLNTKTSYM